MTKYEFANRVECEGWEYVLTEVSPAQLEDAALAEALTDVQEALRILADMTPEAAVSFAYEDEQAELEFG